jgi:glutaredoxin
MLSRLRDTLFRAITTTRGDSFAAVRIPKEIARDLNITFGMFLAPCDELTKRAEAGVRLAERRAAAMSPKDRNVRELARIEELLAAKGIAWKRLDVAGDEATLAFVTLKTTCEKDELPVVFVSDTPVGGYEALVSADISGELARLVHPL